MSGDSSKIEVAGVQIAGEFLLDVLRAAARNGVPAIQFAGDGLGWSSAIAQAIGDQEPLRAVLRDAVAELLRGSPDEVALVSRGILDSRPELAGGGDVIGALQRTDLTRGVRVALATALDQLIKRGDYRYREDLRDLANSPETEPSMVLTYLLKDHAWYRERLLSLPLADATERVIQASLGLTKSELLALRDELVSDQRGAPLVEWLDREAASEFADAAASPTPVRWRD